MKEVMWCGVCEKEFMYRIEKRWRAEERMKERRRDYASYWHEEEGIKREGREENTNEVNERRERRMDEREERAGWWIYLGGGKWKMGKCGWCGGEEWVEVEKRDETGWMCEECGGQIEDMECKTRRWRCTICDGEEYVYQQYCVQCERKRGKGKEKGKSIKKGEGEEKEKEWEGRAGTYEGRDGRWEKEVREERMREGGEGGWVGEGWKGQRNWDDRWERKKYGWGGWDYEARERGGRWSNWERYTEERRNEEWREEERRKDIEEKERIRWDGREVGEEEDQRGIPPPPPPPHRQQQEGGDEKEEEEGGEGWWGDYKQWILNEREGKENRERCRREEDRRKEREEEERRSQERREEEERKELEEEMISREEGNAFQYAGVKVRTVMKEVKTIQGGREGEKVWCKWEVKRKTEQRGMFGKKRDRESMGRDRAGLGERRWERSGRNGKVA